MLRGCRWLSSWYICCSGGGGGGVKEKSSNERVGWVDGWVRPTAACFTLSVQTGWLVTCSWTNYYSPYVTPATQKETCGQRHAAASCIYVGTSTHLMCAGLCGSHDTRTSQVGTRRHAEMRCRRCALPLLSPLLRKRDYPPRCCCPASCQENENNKRRGGFGMGGRIRKLHGMRVGERVAWRRVAGWAGLGLVLLVRVVALWLAELVVGRREGK